MCYRPPLLSKNFLKYISEFFHSHDSPQKLHYSFLFECPSVLGIHLKRGNSETIFLWLILSLYILKLLQHFLQELMYLGLGRNGIAGFARLWDLLTLRQI